MSIFLKDPAWQESRDFVVFCSPPHLPYLAEEEGTRKILYIFNNTLSADHRSKIHSHVVVAKEMYLHIFFHLNSPNNFIWKKEKPKPPARRNEDKPLKYTSICSKDIPVRVMYNWKVPINENWLWIFGHYWIRRSKFCKPLKRNVNMLSKVKQCLTNLF